jgi:hypothetical protein
MFGPRNQMFGARLRTNCPSSEHFIPHRVVAGPIAEGVSAALMDMNENWGAIRLQKAFYMDT